MSRGGRLVRGHKTTVHTVRTLPPRGLAAVVAALPQKRKKKMTTTTHTPMNLDAEWTGGIAPWTDPPEARVFTERELLTEAEARDRTGERDVAQMLLFAAHLLSTSGKTP